MKTYFAFIKHLQTATLSLSIVILCTLPIALALMPEWFSPSTYAWLYSVTHATLFLVMVVRPLADILRGVTWLRPLVILRKGFGVLSASIAVSFILSKIIIDATGYAANFLTAEYWSLTNLALLAHLADISAILLLITSNNLSKRLLGKIWKRIQRLSYVYFYCSSLYVFFILGEIIPLYYLIIVTLVTSVAWLRNHGFILQTHSPSHTKNV
jgi:DMSO/TMAO reductase YedYZ heme-binding membrane subunit